MCQIVACTAIGMALQEEATFLSLAKQPKLTALSLCRKLRTLVLNCPMGLRSARFMYVHYPMRTKKTDSLVLEEAQLKDAPLSAKMLLDLL